MRNPIYEDYPERPPGDVYCRVPQDSPIIEVRGARNIPCETRPGKRAPTVKLCESDEEYIPLNDGWNWKGDPNATITGQGIPDLGPGSTMPSNTLNSAPAIAAVPYDPATGSYIGPDGRLYTQTDLSQTSEKKTWDSMLLPPGS
jgi:phospholipid/cholesterol/gamma-HCH transport system substrate-binding protein